MFFLSGLLKGLQPLTVIYLILVKIPEMAKVMNRGVVRYGQTGVLSLLMTIHDL